MFSQTAEYAMRAMACLALNPGQRISSAALAEMTHVPPDYLAKVLQLLSKANLVVGRRGVGGGYKLAGEPTQIKMLDVVNAVESLSRIRSCPLNLPNHGPNLCAMHRIMDKAAEAVIEVLDGHTLADILAESEGASPLCDNNEAARLLSLGEAKAGGAGSKERPHNGQRSKAPSSSARRV